MRKGRDKKMHESTESRRCQRVTVLLNREQVDFLDKIGKDALFTKGTKISRIKIISCLVNLLLELGINGEGISSLNELKERIKEKMAMAGWPSTKEILRRSNNG